MDELNYYCGICDEEISHEQIRGWGILSCSASALDKARWLITGKGKTATRRCVAYAHRKYPGG